ncbi:MAG: TetR/AcrR family transcriptional regulator [Bacteroidales bacterium]|nr:TetR/AcrR family transcriptional regulator [Bacteroidales bacterium]
MHLQKRMILETVRNIALEEGIETVTVDRICHDTKISRDTFDSYFHSTADLVSQVLAYERDNFAGIFQRHNFENVNAIEILLTVSKEIADKFQDINPFVTMPLKSRWPEEYQKHFNERTDFIFGKIKINLTKGIKQGLYRPDLSIELIARLYISRLIDLHNTELFPPEKFNFNTLFEVMFDNFIRGIATPSGLSYYEAHKPNYSFKAE